ncbi:hypothetical protein M3204_03545 [Mesobacillus subterraneus]|uniref:hypothetical protein n=1 Tax=Mesobacillus subterraneus TaxID=285983 RepID=UPI00203E6372|nr:hypothetical protein [Mesobacillus subterraneus]MCM3663461.1 hypothetical protein [Mesobacillus subterraneus]MCM3683231.1 hypothetical protein [Mesobacillus subterraneus]
MKKFRVTFHFGKENTVSFFTEGENKESILESVKYEEKGFDFNQNSALFRVNLANVNYVSVVEIKKR